MLESIRFIEKRVSEECIQSNQYSQEYINQSVDKWIGIIGIEARSEWKAVLIPQVKQEIFRNLQEGKYYHATL